MNIHEYQAKILLKNFGSKVLNGVAITNKNDISEVIDNFPSDVFVVKAQIHSGGRGKAGGIKIAHNADDAKKIANELWNKTLFTPQTGASGKKIERLYIESGCNIKHEYYISLILDRSNSCITCIACDEGGIDIEKVAHDYPEKIHQIHFNPIFGFRPFNAAQIAFKLNIFDNKLIRSLSKTIESLYNAMIQNDATQIEINPLVLDADDNFIILDAKINFDDNALFKHPNILEMRDLSEEDPLETRAQDNNLSYIRMDGNIGCMVNGAGLAMATMDIIQLYGASPANFLDVGGGADKERIVEALKIILADLNVKVILVNIFGGIMRCDIIANGIIAAARELNLQKPLVVRLAGTNSDLGMKILSDSGLNIITAHDLADAAQKVVNLV